MRYLSDTNLRAVLTVLVARLGGEAIISSEELYDAMMPGSGTLANEVIAGSLEGPGVVLINGEFGARIVWSGLEDLRIVAVAHLEAGVGGARQDWLRRGAARRQEHEPSASEQNCA